MTLNNFCDNSYYTQIDNIKNGFIITNNNSRIGVCGNIIYNKNSESNFNIDITSVNIRLNKFIYFENCEILNIIKKQGLSNISGILIYSPPCEGKTTMLRFLALALSKGLDGLKKSRVALIDEKRELYIKENMSNCFLDVFSGYKKSIGIDCAVRMFNPEVIICDEIGGLEETESILSAQNSGVPLILSAHAKNLSQLKNKPNIKVLIDAGIFSHFVGISLDENNIIKYNIN